MSPRKPSVELACETRIVTPLNCEPSVGFRWPEIETFCAERNIPIGRLGRRPFVLASDLLEALVGARARRWTAEDVEAALARPTRARKAVAT